MASRETTTTSLAGALLGGSVRLRSGENVVIETWSHALPYATACVVEARRRGAVPILLLEDEDAFWTSLDLAPAIARWSRLGRHEAYALAKTDAYVYFPGPADRPRYNALPETHLRALNASGPEWFRRAKSARLRCVRSVLGFASDAQASHWGVSGPTWRNQIVRGTVEADFGTIQKTARRTVQKLQRGRVIRVTAPNGTDVSFRLRGRAPVSDDGVVDAVDLARGRNLTTSPPGSVGVAIDERSAEGIAIANRPSYLRPGRVEGGQWEIHRGHLTSSWYTEGQSYFDAAFEAAPRGRDVVSIFAIGLNGALAPSVPQVEDQELGAVTLGIGGNVSFGGTNRCPFISWIVIGEATVAVDGRPLSDRGNIL